MRFVVKTRDKNQQKPTDPVRGGAEAKCLIQVSARSTYNHECHSNAPIVIIIIQQSSPKRSHDGKDELNIRIICIQLLLPSLKLLKYDFRLLAD